MDDTAALEEERRLFYVGMTRSKMHLYLSFAAMRRRMGQVEDGAASRFLHEVPEECLEEPLEQVSLSALSRYGTRSAYSGGERSWQPRTPALFQDSPQQTPDYENHSQEEVTGYQVGLRVRHDQFGGGTVRRVEGSGEQLRVTVIFDTGTERKFLAHYAPMRPSQGS
jgi:DNA helicase-2/ATP-dependent DNA helicase PcrA